MPNSNQGNEILTRRLTGFEPHSIAWEGFASDEKLANNKIRYQSGFQNSVDLAVHFSNRFLNELKQLANLAI